MLRPKKDLKTDFNNLISQLENMILGGVFQPRERLIEHDLATELGVSRFWIRDALKVLETKGLIKVIPYKGAIVCDLDEEEIEEIFEVRFLLEGLAVQKAAMQVRKADIDFLKRMADQFEKHVQNKDFSAMIAANGRFHDYVHELCGNKNLIQLIKQLQARCHILRYHAWSSPEIVQRIQLEHRKLIAGLEEKDFDQLHEISIRHISYSKNSYLTHLRTKKANMIESNKPQESQRKGVVKRFLNA
jgi:DNA-binding GntR family transcriptional regulator